MSDSKDHRFCTACGSNDLRWLTKADWMDYEPGDGAARADEEIAWLRLPFRDNMSLAVGCNACKSELETGGYEGGFPRPSELLQGFSWSHGEVDAAVVASKIAEWASAS